MLNIIQNGIPCSPFSFINGNVILVFLLETIVKY